MRQITDPSRKRLWALEAARWLRVSRSTLAKWRMQGIGPRHHRCGRRRVYYFEDELQEWLEACDDEA
jgi:predicted DNA-binding transcriptional regulator AlpA